jgi:hypothetical protein
VDLGAETAIDRVTLHWNYNNRPDRVIVDISDDAESWEAVTAIDNTLGASSMNDVILEETVNARYVRIRPTGYRAESPVIGNVPGETGSTGTADAVRQFQLTGFEVYAFRTSAVLDIAGDGTISANGIDYTKANTANERIVSTDADGNLTLQFTDDLISLSLNGEDVIDHLNADNQLVLTDLDADIKIEASFAIKCTAIKIDGATLRTIKPGTQIDLNATLTPANTTDNIAWGSTAPSIVSVDQDGNMTALKYGMASIWVQCGDQKTTTVINVRP